MYYREKKQQKAQKLRALEIKELQASMDYFSTQCAHYDIDLEKEDIEYKEESKPYSFQSDLKLMTGL